MWLPKTNGSKKVGRNGLVAVAIDKDKGSQNALRWALEHFLGKGQTLILIHVVHKPPSSTLLNQGLAPDGTIGRHQLEKHTKDLFLTFHCYCTRKDVHCFDVVLEDREIAKSITEYVTYAAIENLVLGAPSRHGLMRKFKADAASSVFKGAPDFCNVYVISKGKASSVRHASRAAPHTSPLLDHIQNNNNNNNDNASELRSNYSFNMRDTAGSVKPRPSVDESLKSPFARGERGGYNTTSFANYLDSESDISFVSSSRTSTDRASSVGYDFSDFGQTLTRYSTSSDRSFGSVRSGIRFIDLTPPMNDISHISQDSSRTSFSSSQGLEDMESEMRRLKLELKQTMDMYNTACKEALKAKQKASELQHWRNEEEQRLQDARTSEETAMSVAEKEKTKCKAAMVAAGAARRIADLEAQKRSSMKTNALKEANEMKKVMDALAQNNIRYRRYTIEDIEQATEFFSEERKIGEGGYGPVFRCYLDHTPVAVKVLRPDAAQGRSQFQREVEVLSLIRHPNMVLLLGACPEYGILVYEYMAKGSLEDRLFKRRNSPPLPWQLRFQIAAEIGTGLLFLHQTKPEPLVHRDLKPGNILLDNNFVSKISDVGLARLVPEATDNATQCHMTTTAGTFCYIDPEYQQTGMLGVKSDIYSLGIILLQLITGKPPMGLAHYVETAIENDKFMEVLDKDVSDWPVEEALSLAKLAVRCAELRRKDRPDLGKEVLPELNRLREFAEEKMNHFFYVSGSGGASPFTSQVSTRSMQEVMSDIHQTHSSHSSTSSPGDGQAEEAETEEEAEEEEEEG